MLDDSYINQIPKSLKNSKLYDVITTDCQGNYTYVNETFKNKFSFITNDFIGKPSTITMHHDEKLKIEVVVTKCFEQPNECFPLEIRKPLRDGKGYNWTQWEFSAFADKNGRLVGVLCVGFDITGPEHNNLKFKESQTKLLKTIEAIPHPLLILSDKSTINYVNKEFEFIFGYSSNEILGKEIEILFTKSHKKEYNKLFKDYVDDSAIKMREDYILDFVNNADSHMTVGVSLNSFYDNDKLSIIVILEDLTTGKQHQDTIINQNNAFKQIAWKQSHELRKPVANILGLTNLFDTDNLESEINYKTVLFLKEAAKELDQITQSIVKEASESQFDIKFKKHNRNLY